MRFVFFIVNPKVRCVLILFIKLTESFMRLFNLVALILTIAIGVASHANTTTASYYADKFNGRKTANGEVFSNGGMTCASNEYKLGTYVEVTNIKTGKSITCKVNDRIGKAGRIDLTKNAFGQLAPLSAGLVKVRVTPVDKGAKVDMGLLAKNDVKSTKKDDAKKSLSQEQLIKAPEQGMDDQNDIVNFALETK